MVKKVKQKPLVAKISRHTEDGRFWKKLFIISTIALLVLLAGVFAYNRVAIYQEKQDFLAKQEKLEAVADEIETLLGEKAERSTSQTCRRTSVKFEKGEPYCTVRSEIVYENISLKKANNFLKSISAKLEQEIFVDYYNNKESVAQFGEKRYSDGRNDVVTAVVGSLNTRVYSCNAGYYYSEINSKKLVISFSCTDDARAEHFPREK